MNKQPKEEKPKYITDENGTQFFVVGNTKIRVTEHFNSTIRRKCGLIPVTTARTCDIITR